MKDTTECVIVMRERASHEWSLLTNVPRVSWALASAKVTMEQEHKLGNQKFETKVMRRKDWDAKKVRARITGVQETVQA